MSESQTSLVPSAEEFFVICSQMLAAVQLMHQTVQKQEKEIRFLIAELKEMHE